ncbi:DUF1627 domain-containing protein [Yokenella regensburgei]|uniref:DUF1627 domain-containing protein n=1 Tax=Yokenella regensburgei TaxID=158877 RepID=UPI003ED93018
METVLSALKAMGKASAIEIASRTGIDREQVISDLWELKRSGVSDRVGGAWMLLVDGIPAGESSEQEEPSMKPIALPSAKIGEPVITAALRDYGPQTALIEGAGTTMADKVTEPEAKMDMPTFLSTIPKFTASGTDSLIIPTPRGIALELRRARRRVQQLEKLRDAVVVLSRHKALVRQLCSEE